MIMFFRSSLIIVGFYTFFAFSCVAFAQRNTPSLRIAPFMASQIISSLDDSQWNAIVGGLEKVPQDRLNLVAEQFNIMIRPSIYRENITRLIEVLSKTDLSRLQNIGVNFRLAYEPYHNWNFWNYQSVNLLKILLNINPVNVRYFIDIARLLIDRYDFSPEDFYVLISDLASSHSPNRLNEAIKAVLKYRPSILNFKAPASALGKVVLHLSQVKTRRSIESIVREVGVVMNVEHLETSSEHSETSEGHSETSECYQLKTLLTYIDLLAILEFKEKHTIKENILPLVTGLDPSRIDMFREILSKIISAMAPGIDVDELFTLVKSISDLSSKQLVYVNRVLEYFQEFLQGPSDLSPQQRSRGGFLKLHAILQLSAFKINEFDRDPVEYFPSLSVFDQLGLTDKSLHLEIVSRLLELAPERLGNTALIVHKVIRSGLDPAISDGFFKSLLAFPSHLLPRLEFVLRPDLDAKQIECVSQSMGSLQDEIHFEAFIFQAETLALRRMDSKEYLKRVDRAIRIALEKQEIVTNDGVVNAIINDTQNTHSHHVMSSVAASISALKGHYQSQTNPAHISQMLEALRNKFLALASGDDHSDLSQSQRDTLELLEDAWEALSHFIYLDNYPVEANFREKGTGSTFGEVLSLAWLAIHDPVEIDAALEVSSGTREKEILDREMTLWINLGEARREYRNNDIACSDGAFNKIISSLTHVSRFVSVFLSEAQAAELFVNDLPALMKEFVERENLSPVAIRALGVQSVSPVASEAPLQQVYERFCSFLRQSTVYRPEVLPESNPRRQSMTSKEAFTALLGEFLESV